jgi:hypothetical protein
LIGGQAQVSFLPVGTTSRPEDNQDFQATLRGRRTVIMFVDTSFNGKPKASAISSDAGAFG